MMLRHLTVLFTAGLVSLGAHAAAQASEVAPAGTAAAAPLTAVSAQGKKEGHKGGAAPHRAAPHRAAPRAAPHRASPRPVQHRAAPRPAVQHRAAPRPTMQHRAAPGPAMQHRRAVQPHAVPRTVTRQRTPNQVTHQRRGSPGAQPNAARRMPRVTGPSLQQQFGPRLGARIGSSLRVHGRSVRLVRGRHRVHWHNRSLWALPLTALAAIAIGSTSYTPYAYVPVEENYCEGWTEDGCRLRWTWVPTLEGDEVPQCVAYCPF